MSRTVAMAAEALAAVIEQENAALQVMDLPRVTALLDTKLAATEALSAAVAAAVVPQRPSTTPLGQRLQGLIAENRRLLERAMAAQTRVMAIIAAALPRATAPSRYGADGGQNPARQQVPLALSARV